MDDPSIFGPSIKCSTIDVGPKSNIDKEESERASGKSNRLARLYENHRRRSGLGREGALGVETLGMSQSHRLIAEE